MRWGGARDHCRFASARHQTRPKSEASRFERGLRPTGDRILFDVPSLSPTHGFHRLNPDTRPMIRDNRREISSRANYRVGGCLLPRRSEPRGGGRGWKGEEERRIPFTFSVFGRAPRIVSLIATFGRLCVEPTSSDAGLSARVPRENSAGLIRPALADQTKRGGLLPPTPSTTTTTAGTASSPPPLFLLLFLSSFFPFRLSPAARCERLIHQQSSRAGRLKRARLFFPETLFARPFCRARCVGGASKRPCVTMTPRASLFSSFFSPPSPRGERRRVSRATPHDRPRLFLLPSFADFSNSVCFPSESWARN